VPGYRAIPNTFAPEGASRCRALTSGLQGRSAYGSSHHDEDDAEVAKIGAESQSRERAARPRQFAVCAPVLARAAQRDNRDIFGAAIAGC